MPTREEIIEARKKDAQKLEIRKKAEEVAKRLGTDQGYRRHRYEGGSLTIQLDGQGPNLFIYYGTRGVQTKVYYESCTNGLEAFRPDLKGWIEELNRLYTSVIPTREAEEKVEAEKRRVEFIDNWGESPNEVS